LVEFIQTSRIGFVGIPRCNWIKQTLFAFAIFTLMPLPSYAIVCETDFEKLAEALLNKRHQVPVFSGKASTGVDTTIFMSLQGSWSAVIQFPDGNFCITSEGKTAELFPKEMS
jgi:hypothetical protein